MLSKKILPIIYPPPTVMYAHLMIPLSIILAYPNTIEWFLSNYIQLCAPANCRKYTETEDVEFLNFYPKFFTAHSSMFLTVYHLNETIINIHNNEIIDKIVNWINNGYYVQTFLDEAELPGTFLHSQKLSFLNEQIFFGYDLKNKSLQFLSFNIKRKYSIITITFDAFFKAFSSASTKKLLHDSQWGIGKKFNFVLYKFNHNVEYNLNIRNIKTILEEFIYAKNSTYRFDILDNDKRNYVFGMDIYKAMVRWMSQYDSEGIDVRPFYGLWDHKKIMLGRINFLIKNSYLNNKNNYIEKYSQIEKIANQIRMLILKYNIIRKNDKLETITKMLGGIAAIEIDILSGIVNDIVS